MKDKFTFSNPKLSSQYEFIKIIKNSENTLKIKQIAVLRKGILNTKENVANKDKRV